jgi:hypothetical protein
MALTWDITNVKDWESLKSEEQWPITEAFIHYTMAIGIGHWTEKRLPEIIVRMRLMGLDRFKRGNADNTGIETFTIGVDEIRKYIGLKTNVAYETQSKWLKRMYEAKLSDVNWSLRSNDVTGKDNQ